MERGRDLFLLSVFTFLTVLSWMFFELIKTTRTSTITTQVEEIIVPFSPTINTDILVQLEKRKIY